MRRKRLAAASSGENDRPTDRPTLHEMKSHGTHLPARSSHIFTLQLSTRSRAVVVVVVVVVAVAAAS